MSSAPMSHNGKRLTLVSTNKDNQPSLIYQVLINLVFNLSWTIDKLPSNF